MRLLVFSTGVWVLLLHHGADAQADTDAIAKNLNIKSEVISNLVGEYYYYEARITLRNDGDQAISESGWSLYIMSIHMIEYEQEIWKNPDAGYEIPGSDFKVFHINGCLFRLEPTSDFDGLDPGEEHIISLKIQNWNVALTDNMPNWYVVGTDGYAKLVLSTATEQLETFTGSYDSPEQWKRYDTDKFDPWTPEERFQINEVEDLGRAPKQAIPTPRNIEASEKNNIMKPLSGWRIYAGESELQNEANILKDKLNLETDASGSPSTKLIILDIGSGDDDNNLEGYQLIIDGDSESIKITSPTSAGVYYGCQTLISILDSAEEEIESMTIKDSPRFGYRGMHADVARHFVSYDDIVKLLEVMGMYKLNKFHFHVTDDEGWRVEMPWCPSLTDVGATQCHDLDEQNCLIPQFGSRPDGMDRGSGFYTKKQYQDILRVAENHHIEVIPEFDVPGHARAAIKATEAYLKAKEDSGEEEDAREIQLSEPEDQSVYISVQNYKDNAINPCINSTYNFIAKTVSTFVDYHKDIQPLKTMHLGGDEVAEGAWTNSSACKQNPKTAGLSPAELGEHFVQEASKVVKSSNATLRLGLWEDGAITHDEEPFDLNDMATKEIVVNAWQNVWEWGVADRAYKLANAGYKVVMSHATHLYFDHPEEPDPEERGFYWATRFANTQKTFGFMPDDLYANVDMTRAGDPLTEEELCKDGCVQLEDSKKENIIGMQGQVWSETIRTSNQFFQAVFPRLLALAERAWHKADWEDMDDQDEMNSLKKQDWTDFANTLGYKELRRLDEMEISYRVPVPGGRIEGDKLQANSEYPGLEITYSTSDDPSKWSTYDQPISHEKETHLQIRSADSQRTGRVVTVEKNASTTSRAGLLAVLLGITVSRYIF